MYQTAFELVSWMVLWSRNPLCRVTRKPYMCRSGETLRLPIMMIIGTAGLEPITP